MCVRSKVSLKVRDIWPHVEESLRAAAPGSTFPFLVLLSRSRCPACPVPTTHSPICTRLWSKRSKSDVPARARNPIRPDRVSHACTFACGAFGRLDWSFI